MTNHDDGYVHPQWSWLFWHVCCFFLTKLPIPDKMALWLCWRAWYSMYGPDSGMTMKESWAEWRQWK